VVNTKIKEESRKRFTIAHECGHFLLPVAAGSFSTPCSKEKIENWNEQLYARSWMPIASLLKSSCPGIQSVLTFDLEPTMDFHSIHRRTMRDFFNGVRFPADELTSFRAAIVWSQNNNVIWYKSSADFVRWIPKGRVERANVCLDCFRDQNVPKKLERVPASAWLFEKGLKDGVHIWEHSVSLRNYAAVLSLLVMRERHIRRMSLLRTVSEALAKAASQLLEIEQANSWRIPPSLI